MIRTRRAALAQSVQRFSEKIMRKTRGFAFRIGKRNLNASLGSEAIGFSRP
jgi:hypothetical protein